MADTSATSSETGADGAIATAAATAIGGRRLPLSSPSDAAYLSSVACLMRSQLEVFSATEADVQARATFGGLVQKISVGRVGIRCVHCLGRPAADQAKGAVSYPTSIRMLNQATRNWQRFHWVACQFIPPSAREEFKRLQAGKKSKSSRKSQEYWIRRSGEMGLTDTATMTRTAASSPDYTSVDSSGTDDERTIVPDGIYFEEDARKLGLRILVSPPEKASGTTKKKMITEGKGLGKKNTNGGVGTASQNHASNKRKNTGDVSQVTIEDGTNVSEDRVFEEGVRSAAESTMGLRSPDSSIAMHNSLSLANLDVDASFLADLQRLLGEDESGLNSMDSTDGNMPHHSTKSAHAPVKDSNETGGPIQAGMGSTSERDSQLLTTLRAARDIVRSLREKCYGASATGRRTASELRLFGEALYKTLAGEDNTSAVSTVGERSGPGDIGNERSLKRERRRDEEQPGHTRTPLQDLGYPTSISIFVQSLIDATDEDTAERFTSLSDVDNDLRLMIEFPNKYLFDAPPEVLTGRLGFPSDLYGLQMQQNKLMNAFKSVVVTGEERHGLALISGRSGSGKVSTGRHFL